MPAGDAVSLYGSDDTTALSSAVIYWTEGDTYY